MASILILPANSTAGDKITLSDAIKLSLENNNTFKISLEQVNESRLKVREAWGMLWPSLSTDASYTRQWAEAGLYSMSDGQYDITFVNGEIAVNPGVFYNSLQASRNGHIETVNNVKTVKADTIVKTIQSYYQVLLAKETIKMREQSLSALDENMKTVTKGYDKGIFSKLDFLRSKVAFANEKTMLINSENDYLSALAAFNIQIGNEIDTQVNLDFDVINKIDDILIVKDRSKEKNEINKMIKTALKNRPELIQLKSSKAALEYGAGASQSVYLWPSFFVRGRYGASKTIPKEGTSSTGDPASDMLLEGINDSFSPPGWTDSWSITLGASYRWGAWSPLDSSNAKVKQSESQVKQIDYQMEDFIKALKLEVQRGYLKLKSASNSIKSQEGNIESAKETLKVSIEQFRNGIIDNTKLLEANVGLTTALTLYIQALYDYQVAKAGLNKATGTEYFRIE